MEDSMPETPSTMLPLGTKAPDFRLPDTHGKLVSPDNFRNAPALLVVFMCNHCPFVKHIRSQFAELAKEYQARGVGIVGINSNDIEFSPGDRGELNIVGVDSDNAHPACLVFLGQFGEL